MDHDQSIIGHYSRIIGVIAKYHIYIVDQRIKQAIVGISLRVVRVHALVILEIWSFASRLAIYQQFPTVISGCAATFSFFPFSTAINCHTIASDGNNNVQSSG